MLLRYTIGFRDSRFMGVNKLVGRPVDIFVDTSHVDPYGERESFGPYALAQAVRRRYGGQFTPPGVIPTIITCEVIQHD